MHYRTYIMFNNRPPGWWNGSNHGTGSFRLVATQTSLLACTIGQIKCASNLRTIHTWIDESHR